MRTHILNSLLLAPAVAALLFSASPGRAEVELPPMVELVQPGERDGDAAWREAEEAARHSPLQLTVNGVGFDLRPGSRAEVFLQELAEAGSGQYYAASTQGDELALAVSAATTGAAPAAAREVLIRTPQEGDLVGPSVTVDGRGIPGEVLAIYTVPYCMDTGEELKTVPGTRQRLGEDGEFSVRIAMPRVAFGTANVRLRYEIRAHVVRPDGYEGPKTVICVFSHQR